MKKFLTLFVLDKLTRLSITLFSLISMNSIHAQGIAHLKTTNPPSSTVELKEENLDSTIQSSKIPVVVDIYAKWCNVCKRIDPMFYELSQKYEGQVLFVKIDTDVSPSAVRRFGITGLPTILFFSQGNTDPVARHIGYITKENFEEKIQSIK